MSTASKPQTTRSRTAPTTASPGGGGPLTFLAVLQGKRIFLHVRAARQRAEVYLNHQLVGYSIMEELPFECDVTAAARPGAANQLAIRITNPGWPA